MKFLIFTLFFIFTTVYGEDTDFLPCKCRLGKLNRIINGQVANNHSIPWMASLKFPTYTCGGTIVNNNYVMTAANCIIFSNFTAQNITVRLGVQNLNDINVTNTYIGKNIITENITGYEVPGDFALIELDRPIEFETGKIEPACFDLEDNNYEQELLTAGWGDTEKPWMYLNETSKEENLRRFPTDGNLRFYYSNKFPHENTTEFLICTKSRTQDSNICKGDGGGPLMQTKLGKTSVIGITSYMQPREKDDKVYFCEKFTCFAAVNYYKHILRKNIGSNYCNVKLVN